MRGSSLPVAAKSIRRLGRTEGRLLDTPVTIAAAEAADAAAAVAEVDALPACVVAVAAFVVLVDTAVFIAAVEP